MTEFRCKFCKRLLAKIIGKRWDFEVASEDIKTNGLDENLNTTGLEIKCPKCKTLNHFGSRVKVVKGK